jgi:hypothetical protein
VVLIVQTFQHGSSLSFLSRTTVLSCLDILQPLHCTLIGTLGWPSTALQVSSLPNHFVSAIHFVLVRVLVVAKFLRPCRRVCRSLHLLHAERAHECSSKHAPPLQIDTWLEALIPKPGDPKPISFRLVAPAQALPTKPLSSPDAEPTIPAIKLPDPMLVGQKALPSQTPMAAPSVIEPQGPGFAKSEAQRTPSPFDALKKAAEAYAQGKLQQAENPTSDAPKAPPVTLASNHFPAAPIPTSLGPVPGFIAPTDPLRPPGFFAPPGPPGFQVPPSNAPQSTVQRPPQQVQIRPGAAPLELVEEAFSDDEAVNPPSKLSSAAPGGVDLPPGFGFPKPEKPLATRQTAPVPTPWGAESAPSLAGVAPALPRLQEMSTPYSTSGITPALVASEPSVRRTAFGDPDDLPEELLEPPGFVSPNLRRPEPNLEIAGKTGQQLSNSQRPMSASSGGQGEAKETDQKPPGFDEAATGKQVQRPEVVRASHLALGPDVVRNAAEGSPPDSQKQGEGGGRPRPGKRTWSESEGRDEAPRGAKRAALSGQTWEERSGGAQAKKGEKSEDAEGYSRGAKRGGVTGGKEGERQDPSGARVTKVGRSEGTERDSSRGEASGRKTGVRQEQSGGQAKNDEKSKVTEGASRGTRQGGVDGRDKDGRQEQSDARASKSEKPEDTPKGAKQDGGIGRKSEDRQGQSGVHATKAKESEGAERASSASTKRFLNGQKSEEREQQSGAGNSKMKMLEGAEGASREAKRASVNGRKSEEREQQSGAGESKRRISEDAEGASREAKRAGVNGRKSEQQVGAGASKSTKSEGAEEASREAKRAGVNGRKPEEREQQAAKSEKSEEQKKMDAELLRRLEAVKERQSVEEEGRRRLEEREMHSQQSGVPKGKGDQGEKERGSRENEGVAEKSDRGNVMEERRSHESGRTREAEYRKGNRREVTNEVGRLYAGGRRGGESMDEQRRGERREGTRAKDDFAPGKDVRRREEGRREVDGRGKEAERERSVADWPQPRDGRGGKDERSSADGRNQTGAGGRDPDEEQRREKEGTKEQRQPLARLMKTRGVLEGRRKWNLQKKPDPETSAVKASTSGRSMEGQGGQLADEPVPSSTTQLPNPSGLPGHQSRPAVIGASNGTLENAANQARHRLQNGSASLEKAPGRVESGTIARPPSPAGSRSSSPALIRAASPASSDSRTATPRKALSQGGRMELSNLGRPPKGPPARESAQPCRENGVAGRVLKAGDSAQTSGESRNSALAVSTADSVESQMLGVLLGGAESNGDKKTGTLEKEGSGDLALGLTRPSVEARRNVDPEMLGVLLSGDEKKEHGASTRPSEMAPAGGSGDPRVEALLSGLDAKERRAIEVERARRLGEQDRMLEAKKLCLVLDLDHTLLNSAKVGRFTDWKS